jgi:hypothetical protein
LQNPSFVFGGAGRSLPEKIGVNNGRAEQERGKQELTHFTAQLLCFVWMKDMFAQPMVKGEASIKTLNIVDCLMIC